MNYRDLPIRQKVTVAVLLVSVVTLVLATSGVLLVSAITFRKRAAAELRTLSEIMASSLDASFQFDDAREATVVLDRLLRESEIVEAHVFKIASTGPQIFANSPSTATVPDLSLPKDANGLREVPGGLWLIRDLLDNQNHPFAILAVRSNLARLQDERIRSVLMLLAVMAIALLLAFVMASRLKKSITEPISLLAETAHQISRNRDRTQRVRAPKLGGDEVGSLADEFNQMLDTLDGQAAELAEQEERYRLLVENSTELVCEVHPDGSIIYVNPNYERVLGFTQGELKHSNALARVHPDDRAVATAAFQQAEARLIFRTQHKDGSWRWLEAAGRRFRTSRGAEHGVIISRDITERRQSEETLRQSEERYQLAVRGAGAGLWDWNVLTDVVYYSPRFKELLGYGADNFPADFALFANALHPEDVPLVQSALDRHFAPPYPAYAVEYRLRTKAGEYRWFQARGEAIRDEAGRSYRMAGSIIDITERKEGEARRAELESQLRQAQKMEAIGTLAGGIAHDFNNILGAIIAYTELARMEIDDRAVAVEHLGEVLNAGNRAKDLVRQILAFSRQQKQERQPVRLHPVAQEVVKLLRSTLPATIEIQAAIHDSAPTVLADPGQVHQVLLNLCTNAAHAMRLQPGRLTVTLEDCLVDEDLASTHADLRPGRYARVSVEDTGHGMNAETLKRIFDPFFTTKAPGEGTGLGLAVVHGIVHEHGGAISVYSELGVGTTFRLYLPAEVTGTSREEARPAPVPGGTGQRVLYVDDEKALGLAAQRILQRLGYQVAVETNPLAALARFHAAPDAFDLVIIDLNMPGMSGLELATDLLRARPQLPVVLATGFNGAWSLERVRAAGLRGLVMKPFAVEELSRVVHEALGGSRPVPLPRS